MRLQVLALCSVVLSLSACSDDATPSPAGGGASSGGSGGAATGSGGKAGGGGMPGVGGSSAGSASGGKAGSSTGGTGGSGGASGGSGGGGGTGGSGGGKADAEADITLMDLPTGDQVVAGTVHFAQTGAKVTMTFTVTAGCPEGDHAMHFHMNNVCGADGAAAGNHWAPQGEFMGKVTCDAAGKGTVTYSPPVDGTWTIGGAATSDILLHAMVLHEAGDPNPGGRIACGVPVKK